MSWTMDVGIFALQDVNRTVNSTLGDPFPLRPWQLSLYVFISAFGVLGNLLVILVIAQTVTMRKSTFGVYLGGLAVADLLVALVCLPVYITSTSVFTQHPTGLAGDIFCKVISGYNILFFFATISVYTLVAISVERYIAICHPFSVRVHLGPFRAKVILVSIWVFGIILGIPSIIGEKYAPKESAGIGAHCVFSSAYKGNIAPKVAYVCVFIVQFIFPVCCMTFCFVRIWRRLTQKADVRLSGMEQPQPAEEARNKARKKSIQTVVTVTVSYFTCWSMNQVIYFCYNFGLISTSWNSEIIQISVVLCFFSSCINPVIYAFRSKQFQEGFTNILCCCSIYKRRGAYQQLV